MNDDPAIQGSRENVGIGAISDSGVGTQLVRLWEKRRPPQRGRERILQAVELRPGVLQPRLPRELAHQDPTVARLAAMSAHLDSSCEFLLMYASAQTASSERGK
jgi:hypothetical protein